MAVPYMFGPGGQPILMGQIPTLMQPQTFQATTVPKPPPRELSEEKLNEKGNNSLLTDNDRPNMTLLNYIAVVDLRKFYLNKGYYTMCL